MKMKKCLLLSFALLIFMVTSSFSPAPAPAPAPAPEEDSIYIGEVTVRCSSGTTGRCFKIYCDYYSYDSLVDYVCIWSGNQSNYCSLLALKICNIIVGNFF